MSIGMNGKRRRREQTGITILGLEPETGRWLFIVIGLFINLALGSIYAWSVFLAPLTTHFQGLGQQVSASDVLLPFSLFLVSFALTMPLAGGYIETQGPRRMTLLGGLLTGVGWLLASLATSPGILSLAFGIIGGTGVGVTYGVPLTLAARWFPDRRGMAMGLTLLGFGVSALLTGWIASFLLASYGVLPTFRLFGIFFLCLIPLCALPLFLPPAEWKPTGWTPHLPGAGPALSLEYTHREMIRTPAFYGLWICFFIACAAGLIAVSIALPVGTETVGLESGMATLLVGFFAIFNGGGRPIFGALTDWLNPRNTAMLSFGLIILASLLLWQVPTVPMYILAFALLWGSLGAWPAIAPISTVAFFGTRDYSRCYGVVYLAYGAGALAGPMLAGSIHTSTGSYLGVFPCVAGFAVIGIMIAYLLLHPPERVTVEVTEAG